MTTQQTLGEGKGHQFSRSIKTEWLFPQLLERKTTIFLFRLFLGPAGEAGVILVCERWNFMHKNYGYF